MESFRALKFSKQESFRALKFSFRVLNFRVRKFSNLESFRALKLSDHESFRVRKFSFRVLTFQGPKTLQSGEFQGPKTLHSGDGIYIQREGIYSSNFLTWVRGIISGILPANIVWIAALVIPEWGIIFILFIQLAQNWEEYLYQ